VNLHTDDVAGLRHLVSQIRDLEERHGMSSDVMESRWRLGLVDDTEDVAKWFCLLEAKRLVTRRLMLETASRHREVLLELAKR
jgi:hypothetical protein